MKTDKALSVFVGVMPVQCPCRVKKMLDEYKLSVAWDERHIIGVHIRRTDLAITQPDVSSASIPSLWPSPS